MFGKKDDKRFEIIYKQDGISGYRILLDKQTGVNYLFAYEGYAGGLTPLLNNDGTPVVTPIANEC